jgi:hypothetical protein
MSKLGEYRDANFHYQWGGIREASLLEEGDVVAITDGSAGIVNLPVMIEELNINPKNTGPEISFTAQKFSNSLYDSKPVHRVEHRRNYCAFPVRRGSRHQRSEGSNVHQRQ